MKVFAFLACLVAAAMATPESDAQLLVNPYSAWGYRSAAINPYWNTLGYSSLYSTPYNTLGYRYIAKRDADADSDAQLYSAYGSLYSPYSAAWGYRSAAINPYWNTLGYSSVYSTPYNALGYRYIAKREADAESDAQMFYTNGLGLNAWNYAASYLPYTTAAYTTVAKPAIAYAAKPIVYTKPVVAHAAVATAAQHPLSTSPVALNNLASPAYPAVPGAYAAAGRYEANSAGVVHKAKRDADSDAQLFYNNGLGLYRNNFAYNYATVSPYRYTAATYSPYTYGARYFNGLYY